ncbi:MAG: class I SAM-dependent methyltransferase [Propionibacteriales bacterium]|nr:class I SAM-dependent methyltransferase [Propionibacteriales bacterium]
MAEDEGMHRAGLIGAPATLLGTLWARVLDARSRRPVLGDESSVAVADQIDQEWSRLGVTTMMRLVTCVRAVQFDRWADEFLARHRDAVVIQLGVGLDTRHARITSAPGVEWFDVDLDEVINLRRRVIGEMAGVTMISSSAGDPKWLDQVPSGRPTLIIAEGLSMYLDPRTGGELLHRLSTHFDGALIMDVNSSLGVVGQFMNRTVRGQGARWTWLVNRPRSLQRYGLRLREVRSSSDLVFAAMRGRVSPIVRQQYRLARLAPGARGAGRLLRFTL